jgi:predicted nucleic acid-binding protein
MPAFFDTSVLVAGLIDLGATSEFPQRIMTAIANAEVRRAATAWHCCLEFYSVATRLPEEFRVSPEDALRLLEEEVLARLEVRQLPESARHLFLRVLARDRVVGGRVYDAHIAEIARRSGARTVVTDNQRHFASLARHDIRVLSAAEFVRSSHLSR